MLEAAIRLRQRGTNEFHGYALAKILKNSGNHRRLTAQGTLYRALHRLEAAGLVESFWEDSPEAEREGRPRRRMYRLTMQAEGALAGARDPENSPPKKLNLKLET